MLIQIICFQYLASYALSKHIPDQYIVVLRNDNKSSRSSESSTSTGNGNARILNNHLRNVRSLMTTRSGGNMTSKDDSFRHIYNTPSFMGYAGRFDSHIIQKVQDMDEVEYIEKDSLSYAYDWDSLEKEVMEVNLPISSQLDLNHQNDDDLTLSSRLESVDEEPSLITESNSPWGLARISRRTKLDDDSTPGYTYFSKGDGEGVTVYVIDTGININHEDFQGRARWGTNVVPDGPQTDDNGHGTHVAGTVGGVTYGVAKKAELVAVKVLGGDGSGSNSDIIAGINWAINDAKKKRGGTKGSVANMSLGGSYSRAVNMAVDQAVESGLAFAVAAGNDNADACGYSPASSARALSVGATNIKDFVAGFSNYGKCVSIFAPGERITSTWIGSKSATKTISGTSMASPHMAGLMASFMSLSSTPLTPDETYNAIKKAAIPDVILKMKPSSPNLMAFNLVTTPADLPALNRIATSPSPLLQL